MQKENEWKDKMREEESKLNAVMDKMKGELKLAQNDKELISKTYESQLKMMSETIVDLQAQIDNLEKA